MSNVKTRSEMLIDEKWFSTPDMGEYLDGTMIQQAAEELAKGKVGGEFFIETPFAVAPGYYDSENVIIISGKPSLVTNRDGEEFGKSMIDGDTIYLGFDEILDGGKAEIKFNATEEPMSIIELLKHTANAIEDSEMLGLRILGINTPEKVNYRTIKSPKGNTDFIVIKYKDLLTEHGETEIATADGSIPKANFNYIKYNTKTERATRRDPEEEIMFIHGVDYDEMKGKDVDVYFEVTYPAINSPHVEMKQDSKGQKYGTIKEAIPRSVLDKITMCVAHGARDDEELAYYDQAKATQQSVFDLIRDADDIIYMLDQSYFAAKAKGVIPFDLKKEYEKISANPLYAFRSLWKNLTEEGHNAYQQLGKRYFGQELNGRYLSACYLKMKTEFGHQWINLAKYLIYHYDQVEVIPNYSNSGASESEFNNVSDAFKLWTYDNSKSSYLDAINATAVDDRADIQRAITGVDISELTNHTVMLGDVLLLTPPTSIRSVTQTRSDRISLLRAKGGLTRSLPKTERMIEMQLYFNGDEAINGVPYTQVTPSGQEMTFFMNGLRALIAQFKFTPFVPIHNDYINHVLNIEAVSLNSLEINTIPNYPRTLQVTITLQEFDYRQYMPEILPPDLDMGQTIYTNLFAKTIHWPVFRYYYQRAIHNGESLEGIKFDSDEYLHATLGQKTALQRAKFMTPLFDLYVANEEHLKQRKNLKLSLERNPIESIISFNPEEEKFLRELATLYQQIRIKMAEVQEKYITNGIFNPPANERVLLRKQNNLKEEEFRNDFTGLGGVPYYQSDFGISHGKIVTKLIPELSQEGEAFEESRTREQIHFDYLEPLRTELFKSIQNGGDVIIHRNFSQFYIPRTSGSILTATADGAEYRVGLKLKINWGATGYSETKDKVQRLLAKQLQTTTDEIFKDDTVFVGWCAEFEKCGHHVFNMMQKTSGPAVLKDTNYEALKYLLAAFGGSLDTDSELDENMWNKEEDLGDMKDNIDLEGADSLKFDFYDLGNPIINSIRIGYNNIFNNMSMKMYDGYASQYTGGTDTTIDIEMTALNEYTVSKLQLISRVCSQRLIDFRKVIASSPLRIDSEMTRLIGVNEVIIESVDINTIPNYPGTWTVLLRLVSVDRTLRNREALKKVDEINNYSTDHDFIVKTKNFFDVKNALSRIELYPDLELPTLNELSQLGYNYIKYKNTGTRLYPDADFYFAYLHVFTADMIRESIVDYFKDSNNLLLKQAYSGNLFHNDNGVVSYDLSSPMTSQGHAGENFDSSDSQTYPVESTIKDTFFKARYANDSDISYTEIISGVNGNNDATKGKDSTKDTIKKKSQEMKDVMNRMAECLESGNYTSFNFNSFTKVSVKDSIPFYQSNGALIGKKNDKVFKHLVSTPDQPAAYIFEEVVANGERVKITTDSIKTMILDILVDPIITFDQMVEKGIGVLTDLPMYSKFLTYIISEVLGGDLDPSTFATDPEAGVTLNLNTLFDVMLEAFARGATANFAMFDVSEKEAKTSPDVQPIGVYKKIINGKSTEIKNIHYSVPGQVSTYALAETEEEIKNGSVFGRFAIKKYSASVLSEMYNGLIINNSGFADPYYNLELHNILFPDIVVTQEEMDARIAEYINLITEEPGKVGPGIWPDKIAFFRIMLIWLYKFLTDNRQSLLPDAMYMCGEVSRLYKDGEDLDDGMLGNVSQWFKTNTWLVGYKSKAGKETSTSSDKEKYEESVNESDMEDRLEDILDDLKEDLPRMRFSFLSGLLLTLGTIALTETSSPVYSSVVSGNIGNYISYIEKIKGTKLSAQDLSKMDTKVRKVYQSIDYVLYKAGYESYVSGLNTSYASDEYSAQGKMERLYLQAADTPAIYLMHSFYDMIMHDMRGRMARAFPTYYMLLIDEGRDLGVWRLQDNFYDVSAIQEFQVVKSRKIAADTAKIVMTNLFGTFTTEDDDMKDEYQYTFKDMWNSLFSPLAYMNKEYERYSEARDINRAKLKAGARVNLRIGYSADASSIPVMFNGCVAEIQEGELMTIICQGDGIELSNPDMFSPTDAVDVADLTNNDSLFSKTLGIFESNTTPREMLINPLVASGDWIHEKVKNWTKGRLFNSNPFGIVHFGDKHFKEIFGSNGEVAQNIYEGLSKPTWGEGLGAASIENEFNLEDAPSVKVELHGKSYWDLMHISASISPDFICAIAPFQLRSTVFHGAPRYYYAYDYDRLPNGQIVEKRKPYQQYHIYTSYTDILNNGITASNREISTVGMGVYTAPGTIVADKVSSVGPMFLDIDIYPENQKTTTINCNFEYKPYDAVPFTIPIAAKWNNEFSETGGYQIAWRATANGLKNTVKDMYSGELIVIGDPTVKPHDRVFISDLYEDIQGSVEVETVVHTFSVETGYTTSITPDCIVAIDNKYEQLTSSFWSEWGAPTVLSATTLMAASAYTSKIARGFFFSAEKAIDIGSAALDVAIGSVSNILGKDNTVALSPYADSLKTKLGHAFGVTTMDMDIFKTIKQMEAAYDSIRIERTLGSSKDLALMLDDIIKLNSHVTTLNPSDLAKKLDDVKINSGNKSIIEKAKSEVKHLTSSFNNFNTVAGNGMSFSGDDISTVLNSLGSNLSDDALKAKGALQAYSKKGVVYGTDEYLDCIKNMKVLSGNIDDFTDTSKALKVFDKINDAKILNSRQLNKFASLADDLADVNKIAKGAKNIKALLASNLILLVAEIVITKSVQEFIERKLKNWQVLTVFPITKNGLVMTAGLDGNKGSVFGSPTYNTPGFLEDMAIKFFEYKGTGLGSSMWAFLRDFFITTEEMRETINGYKRDNGFGQVTGSSDVERQSEISKLLNQVAKNNISGFNAYKQLYFDDRVVGTTSDDFKAAYHKYSLTGYTERELTDTKVIPNNLIYIREEEDGLLRRLTDANVFRFVADNDIHGETLTTSYSNYRMIVPDAIESASDKRVVYCKKMNVSNGENKTGYKTLFSIPYLRPDALVVLNMIVERICYNLQSDYLLNECKFENMIDHKIILHNGTIINSESFASTGYCFTLEVKNYDNFSNIVNEIIAEDKSISDGSKVDFRLIEARKNPKLGNHAYDFYVSPPKI